MVSPDLDVVAVTTGRENYRLSEVADSISRSVKSDTSLPADSEGAQLLANKILDVSTGKPTQVGAKPGKWGLASQKRCHRFSLIASRYSRVNTQALSLVESRLFFVTPRKGGGAGSIQEDG